MVRGGVLVAPSYLIDAGVYCLVCLVGLQCILGFVRRSDIRSKYGLIQEPCADFIVHWCCHNCAQCQENRELKLREMTSAAVQMPIPLAPM